MIVDKLIDASFSDSYGEILGYWVGLQILVVVCLGILKEVSMRR
jgi:hypothetical protein